MSTVTWSSYKLTIERSLPWILSASFIAALVAYSLLRFWGPTYEVHFSYVVSLAEREPAADFRFDGYYALQATDLFSQTLAEWIQTPEIVIAAYTRAALPAPPTTAAGLRRMVTSAKRAPQLVVVTVQEKTPERALALTESLQVGVAQNITTYNDSGTPLIRFRAIHTEPWSSSREPATTLTVTVVFLAVLILGINAVLIVESLKRP